MGLTAPTTADAGQQLAPSKLAAVLVLALAAHAIYWTVRPPDMHLFLEPWLAHIVRFGPIGAFARPFSNYEPAYLYLLAGASLASGWIAPMAIIKALSVAGSLFLTAAVANLLKTMGTSPRLSLFTLVLPTAVINAALLGQCDALWAGSCILALSAMMRGRTVTSLAWCGLAMAFKSQAAFIAPVIIGALIGRRAALWQWLVPPGVFFATLIPAWSLGWPLIKLLTVYAEQAAWVHIPGKLGNPWMAATIFADHASRPFFVIGYAAAALAAVAIAALAATSFSDRRKLLLLALLSAVALPFFLPKMLERYYFLGDVLALVLALSFQTRRAVAIAVAVQGASLVSLLTYIYWFHWPYPALLGIPLAGFAIALAARLLSAEAVRWPRLHVSRAGWPRLPSDARTAA